MGLPRTNPGLKLGAHELQIQRSNHWATLPPLKRKDRLADLKGNKKSNERIDKSGNGLAGLKITAGQRTMSGLIVGLTGQTLV